MIAIDTNILVYAHRRESVFFEPARQAIAELVGSGARWAIPYPCLHEFYGVVTHPKVYKPASTCAEAARQIEIWLESPMLVLLAEDASTWTIARGLIAAGQITGPKTHDARVAAICIQHAVTELWTCDRDYSRFPGLRIQNPLVPPPTRAGERRAAYTLGKTKRRASARQIAP